MNWLTGLAKCLRHNPGSVTEPEAIGVPGWQTGTCTYIRPT